MDLSSNPSHPPSNFVLVTGVAGFIGSHVASHCLKLGFRVVGLDNLSGGFSSNVPDDVTFYKGDITDAELLGRLFSDYRFRFVYHLAAYAAEGMSHFVRSLNYRTNLVGSAELLNQAVKHNVECFLFTSSMSVYGSGTPPFTEDMPLNPEDPYAISKYAFELDLEAAHRMWGMDYVIFRPHNVYGPHQNLVDKYRNVVSIFMNQCAQGNPLTIFGDGEQTRAFSSIDDVAPLLAKAPSVVKARNQVFNIGGDTPCTINELARHVCQAMGNEHKVVHFSVRKEVKTAFSSHKKLRQYFDYPVLTVPLSQGLADMASWVKGQWEFSKAAPSSMDHAFVPIVFKGVEVKKNIPPSWDRPDLLEVDTLHSTDRKPET